MEMYNKMPITTDKKELSRREKIKNENLETVSDILDEQKAKAIKRARINITKPIHNTLESAF